MRRWRVLFRPETGEVDGVEVSAAGRPSSYEPPNLYKASNGCVRLYVSAPDELGAYQEFLRWKEEGQDEEV